MYAIPTTKSVTSWGSGQSTKTLKRHINSGGNSRRPATPAGPKSASRFPQSSYVLNPPGTRPKPATTFPNKDFTIPIKDGSWKQSVFRRAWADMSDSSEEESLACEMPPLLPEAASSSDRKTLTGLSRRAYGKLRRYAFWKVRKGHGQRRPKDPNSRSASSSDSQSVAPCYDSLSLLSFVDESAHQDGNGTGEDNRTPGNAAESGTQGQVWGEPQDNAAVSRCILRAVWSRVAVRGIGSSIPSQPSRLANPLQHTPRNCRNPMVSPTQTARVCARGRSLTPKPLTSTPKPVSSNNQPLGLRKASNSRAGGCLGGDPIVFNRVSESAVPRRDHITMQFDATKGTQVKDRQRLWELVNQLLRQRRCRRHEGGGL